MLGDVLVIFLLLIFFLSQPILTIELNMGLDLKTLKSRCELRSGIQNLTNGATQVAVTVTDF